MERVLSAHNPFRDNAVRHGFEAPDDVPEIHASARAQLRALIEECRSEGRPRLQVVTGEPGDGKTHLLACLRAEADASWRRDAPFLLAPIDPLRDVEAPFVHLLRGLGGAGMRTAEYASPEPGMPATPLEFLLWRILRRGIASLEMSADAEIAAAAQTVARLEPSRWPALLAITIRERWDVLAKAMVAEVPRHAPFLPPIVDGEIWQAICRLPEAELAPGVCRWLSGRSLPESELDTLGVSESLDSEDRAFRALSTLANLSDVPLVLGLDQLEGVRRLGEDAVPSLFSALTQLYSAGGRMVGLLFCQAAIWAELREAIPQHARDRLEPREIALGGVPPDQGELIVSRRLLPLWRSIPAAPPHSTAPYPEGWVRAQIAQHGLRKPRGILSFFAQVGLTDRPPGNVAPAPPHSPEQQVTAELASIRDDLARGERSAEDRAELGQASLAGLLARAAGKTLGDTAVVAARKQRVGKHAKEGIEARLQRGGREVRVYAELHNGQNGVSADAAVRRCERALEQRAERAMLIREESLPLPSAAATRLAKLGARGALVRVPLADALDLGAIEKLFDAAAAGELQVDEATARKVVDESLAKELKAVRLFLDAAFAQAPAASVGANARELIAQSISSPPHVIAVAKLAKGNGMALEELMTAAETMEREGAVQILTDRDGARAIARRP